MSLLADACAGTTKRKITDRVDAYSWIHRFATAELDGEYILGKDVSQVALNYERLITISIKVLDTDALPISTLVAMRRREAKERTHDYRVFRINYLKKVDEYVEKLTGSENSESDIKEIQRQFEKDMDSELKSLRRELAITKDKLILSKEVAVACAAAKGAFSAPISGITDLSTIFGAIGIGALVRIGKEYKNSRGKALEKSPMAWLYLSSIRANGFDPRRIII
ncbi:hypothetical protein GCM10023184_26850 [Flaviaesturariibacter amylovorans]|uniref:Uncharacterized protein n=2 Tax=Flaviaesturariibacter amylovorans TaxID=1084520 RepID=A0ABP8H3C9_9BACT